MTSDFTIHSGDAVAVLQTLPSESVNCCITSPPYFGLRDYSVDGQIGLEETPEQYIERLVAVFREVRRVLRDDATLWVNIGDSYAGGKIGRADAGRDIGGCGGNLEGSGNPGGGMSRSVPDGLKSKDLIGVPWMLAFALRADGWYLRSEIIWHKPNPMPESVRDRPTKAHEQIFLLSKSPKYYYDGDAIQEPLAPASLSRYDYSFGGPKREALRDHHDDTGLGSRTSVIGNRKKPTGRNKRSVWKMATKPFKGAHFAVFPPELPMTCLLAGCPKGGIVLDPFSGAATTGIVATQHGRRYIGVELNPEYIAIANKRYADTIVKTMKAQMPPLPAHQTGATLESLFVD